MSIARKKIYEEISDIILAEIKSGKLKPGDKLPVITKLADSYGVSQASVREALNRLKVLEVIEVKHGHGSFVNQQMPLGFEQNFEIITKADIANLLDLRKIIEVGCARSACEKAEQKDLEKMENTLQKMWTAVENNELGEQADYDFHMAIAEATGNPLLINLMEDVSDTMIRTMKETRRIWLYETKKSIQKIYDEHKLILKAIKDKDEEAAARNMYRHLKEVEDLLLTHY
ncbi:FadR/GntR family transcriptional regulator [Salinicoccus sp. YB14-2]|uniref:FadR/GntR family transcriptional regulator n=1 Tax=Salinicoccus sp. YB14-2 TaxID=1572701 RepID=UPI0006914BB8|nr:FadR/GntR family transcriptional regulator [Salinicoccus sp. YB14-2]